MFKRKNILRVGLLSLSALSVKATPTAATWNETRMGLGKTSIIALATAATVGTVAYRVFGPDEDALKLIEETPEAERSFLQRFALKFDEYSTPIISATAATSAAVVTGVAYSCGLGHKISASLDYKGRGETRASINALYSADVLAKAELPEGYSFAVVSVNQDSLVLDLENAKTFSSPAKMALYAAENGLDVDKFEFVSLSKDGKTTADLQTNVLAAANELFEAASNPVEAVVEADAPAVVAVEAAPAAPADAPATPADAPAVVEAPAAPAVVEAPADRLQRLDGEVLKAVLEKNTQDIAFRIMHNHPSMSRADALQMANDVALAERNVYFAQDKFAEAQEEVRAEAVAEEVRAVQAEAEAQAAALEAAQAAALEAAERARAQRAAPAASPLQAPASQASPLQPPASSAAEAVDPAVERRLRALEAAVLEAAAQAAAQAAALEVEEEEEEEE